MPQQNCAVILAAGEGKRMKRARPKALSPVLFKPMLQWVLDSVSDAGIGRVCVVTGFMHGQVETYLRERDPGTAVAFQAQRLGTGHAVLSAAGFLCAGSPGGNTLILNGDAPFLDAAAIRGALQAHCESRASVTVISAVLENPTGYGRIIRGRETNTLEKIVEQKDASPQELAEQEVNSGAYWFRTDDLLTVLPQIKPNNAQGEYYLTDAVQLLLSQGKTAQAFPAGADAVLGANDCLQLYELNVIARDKILAAHMRAGVEIPCRDGVMIGPDVTIGADVTILPGTVLRGKTALGDGCVVGPNTVLCDCTVKKNVVLDSVRGFRCTVEENTPVKPFSVLADEGMHY